MARPFKGVTFHDRVREKTVVNEETGCWEWTGCKDDCGYGRIWRGDGLVRLHRETWKDANGPIPQDMCVCHSCDNRACINPDHLFLGTHQDNMADMVAKGRAGNRGGESCPSAKLSRRIVSEIKRDLRRGARGIDLARRHGVTSENIYSIAKGRTWRDVEAAA